MRLPSLLLTLTLAATGLFAQAPKPRVRLVTSFGPVVLELEPEAAPATVENFLRYVKEGFYAGTLFHRVIPHFMIQGGGLTEDMREKPTHPPIPNEAERSYKAGLLNRAGTVAMARTEDPDSATAQFFINTVDNPSLDFHEGAPAGAGYSAFGRVVEGMDVVAKIERVVTVARKGMVNVPEYPVRLKSAELLP